MVGILTITSTLSTNSSPPFEGPADSEHPTEQHLAPAAAEAAEPHPAPAIAFDMSRLTPRENSAAWEVLGPLMMRRYPAKLVLFLVLGGFSNTIMMSEF